jgi:hypothetical protein
MWLSSGGTRAKKRDVGRPFLKRHDGRLYYAEWYGIEGFPDD